MNRWTRLGIEAYRAGNRQQAQRFFRFALMEKPDDIRTLLWMVEVADTDTEKERCLERVLQIDPQQSLAKQALVDVKARLESAQLPHVNPFAEDGSEGMQPVSERASIAVRSTPPFMEALAVRKAMEEAPPALPVSVRGGFGFQKKWLWVGLAVLAVILVIALGFIIRQAL
jgi:hypothetical protein